ncbi:TonB-dependent receptor [Phenylobacterium sp. LjRoot219]|uniref:TonB-dependent receptor plug domain-containing protein n=1 Tax=Phenylobacterium sp. LjRoot219 TaxID=3342283 RepID=UPI003ECE5C32
MQVRFGALARRLAAGTSVAALLPTIALAQAAAPTTGASAQTLDEVVVTGTLIRGIAPAGSNVIGLGAQTVETVGGNSTNQILNSLPQVGNYFNALPVGVSAVSGSNGSNPISRPNLRNLPAANTSGGAQTLVLLDGHRVVGAGTQQVAVDPDIIAPGVIERVEAMTDGGSAVYGSDALGGVLNFITRRRFDGLQLNSRVGFADNYSTFAINGMAGKDWGSGSGYLAYGYKENDAIFGADRDYVKRIDWNTGVPTGRNCATPTASIGAQTFLVSGSSLVAGGPATCDLSQDSAIYPKIRQHNVFGRVTQDLSETLVFDMTALYANRVVTGNGGTLGAVGSTTGTVNIGPTNPRYISTGGATATATQTVRFNYGPVAGFRSNTQRTELETWNVAPALSWDFAPDWQARGLVNYGESEISYRNNVLDPAAQSAALAAGRLNPYDIAASDPAALQAILGGLERGNGKNEFVQARAIVDGPVAHLPGGDIHVAFGAEYQETKFKRRQTNAALVLSPFASYTQDVQSLFGEVQVPLVGVDNAITGVQELTLQVSGRYDKYNDFGDTFNPKVGVTFKPVDWVSFRGNWGKSFNAPSPADQLGPLTATANLVPGAFLAPPPGQSFATGETGVYLGGGSVSGLEPQTAKNWSIGADITPPIVEGLKISASYYAIDLKGTIGRPVSGTSLTSFYNNFPGLWTYRPTGQQVAAVLANMQNPANVGFTLLNPTATTQALVSSGGSGAQPVGVILDTLVRNLGQTDLSGIDFQVSYAREVGFGSIDASVAGNYRLTEKTKISPVAPATNQLATENSKLMLQTTLGATAGNLRSQVTWNHTSGYRRGDAGTPGAFGQDRVKAFNAVNLFFKYDVNGSGLYSDLAFTLNVDNVFDEDPPLYKNSGQPGYDPSHTFTLGRYVQFGIEKKF